MKEKKNIWGGFFNLIVLGLLFSGIPATATADDISVTLSAPATVGYGGTLKVDVKTSPIINLGGAQFVMGFNPAVFKVEKVEAGPIIPPEKHPYVLWNSNHPSYGPGNCFVMIRLPVDGNSWVTRAGTLATVTFNVIGTSVDPCEFTLPCKHVLLTSFMVEPIKVDCSDNNPIAPVTVIVASAVNTPTNLKATAPSSTQINLTWNDNSDNEDGFKIERKGPSESKFSPLVQVGANVSSYINSGLTSNTQYCYRVRGYKGADHSPYSNEACATTPNVLPVKPCGLELSVLAGPLRVKLTWQDESDNETDFRIERKRGGGGTYLEITTVPANTTTYEDTGVDEGEHYCYRVRAHNEVGFSPYGEEVCTATGAIAPLAPTDLVATPLSTSRIDLAWRDNACDETEFRIRWRKGESGAFSEMTTVGPDVTSYSHTGLEPNTHYYYRVSAYNKNGESTYAEANAWTKDVPPAAPTSLKAVAKSSNQIDLSWHDNSYNEDGFRLERKKVDGTFTLIATLSQNVTTYSDTPLEAETTYCYQVKAYHSEGESSYSAQDCATTLGAARINITAPATVRPGSVFQATLNITQVTQLDSLQFDFHFNPNVLQVISVQTGDLTAGASLVPNINNGTGLCRVTINLPMVDGVSGAGELAKLQIKVVGAIASSSELSLSKVMLVAVSGATIPFELDPPVKVKVTSGPPVGLKADGSSPSPWKAVPDFRVSWDSPSGHLIRGAWYKTGSPPLSDKDGIFRSTTDGFFTAIATAENGQPIWVWLEDAAGEVDFHDSASVVLRHDATPPTTPVVIDEGASTQNYHSLRASWSSTDAGSGLGEFRYGIGTTQGKVDVLGWQSAGLNTEVTVDNLDLVMNTYYFAVKAADKVGNESLIGTSDGILVDTSTVPYVRVVSPNGGEYWQGVREIRWVASAPYEKDLTITIKYSTDGGTNWNILAANEINDGSYSWSTTSVSDGSNYFIRIEATDGILPGYDVSNDPFTIDNTPHRPVVTVVVPNGGEYWQGTQEILWTASDKDGDSLSIDLHYSVDAGASWNPIALGLSNSGSYLWNTRTVSDGRDYLIRVTAHDLSPIAVNDVSDGAFTIDNEAHVPEVKVLEPNGGEKWGGIKWIKWKAMDEDCDVLKITIELEYPVDGLFYTIARNELNDGLFAWDTRKVPDGAGYRIRVIANDGSPKPGQDLSDGPFKIDNDPHPPQVRVISPNGGENWSGVKEIIWEAVDPDLEDPAEDLIIDIEWSSNSGLTWFLLAGNEDNDGSYPWNTSTVPNGVNYLIRVTARDGNGLGLDTSDSLFRINNNNHTPTVTILYPAGGETLKKTVEIKWQAKDIDGDPLKITILVDGNVIAADEFNDGSFNWNTTTVVDGSHIVTIRADDGSEPPLAATAEVNSDPFTVDNLYAPQVTLISPRGGEHLSGLHQIIWEAADPDYGIEGFTLQYRIDSLWYTIPGNLPPNSRSYLWNTASVGDNRGYVLKITVVDEDGLVDEDISDAFTIDNDTHTPSIMLISPQGGELWKRVQEIRWEGRDFDDDPLLVRIEVSADGGNIWYLISEGEENDGVYAWDSSTVADGVRYKIRVTISDGVGTATDTSRETFIIDNIPHKPIVELTAPNGGEVWNSTQPISWHAVDSDQEVLKIDLFLSRDQGVTWEAIAAGLVNTNGEYGHYDWDTTQVEDGLYLVKVVATDSGGLSAWDVSNTPFEINNPSAPIVNINSPGEGDKVRGTVNILWEAVDNDGDELKINIDFSRDNGATWQPVVNNEANDGSYAWDTDNLIDGANYRIKIRAREVKDPFQALSTEVVSGRFMVDNDPQAPIVVVTAPNGGEILTGVAAISWTATDLDEDTVSVVNIEVSANGGDTWTSVLDGESDDSSFKWNTDLWPDGSSYLVRVVVSDGELTASDVSDDTFSLNNPKPPVISLIAPNGGEIWSGIKDISWKASDPDGDTLSIDIFISPDNGLEWSLLSGGERNDGAYSFNTSPLADGYKFLVRVEVTDGQFTAKDISEAPFTIGHLVTPAGRSLYEGSRLRAIFGAGAVTDQVCNDEGEIIVFINNESEITTAWQEVSNIDPIRGTVWEYRAVCSDGTPYTGDFDQLVEVRIPYPDKNQDEIVDGTNISVDELHMYRLNKDEAVWETIEDGGVEVVDKRNKEVKTGVIYFSIYCLAGSPSGTPQVTLLSPSMTDEYWWGNREIRWEAGDPDGDPLTIDIDYQVTTGVGETSKWYSIAKGELNDGLYVWNTWTVADGQHYLIRVSASDGTLVGYAKSKNLIIDNNPHTPHVRVVSPNGGEVLRDSGFPPTSSSIRWVAGDKDGDPLTFTLDYSVDKGYHWYTIVSGRQDDVTIFTVEDNVYSYSWDTTTVADGQNYLVRVKVSDPSPRSSWDASDAVFTIDNSKNRPVVKILQPAGGESLKGTSYIKWEAWDSDGDKLTITIQYSIDNETWYTIADNERNDGAYRWDTRAMADGDNYLIKIIASDGTQTEKDQLKTAVRIDNQPFAPVVEVLSPNGREYWQGVQNLQWTAYDVDGDNLTYTVSYSPDRGGHWYEISPLDITKEETGRFRAPWDTKTVPDGVNYLIKVKASDGVLTGSDQSNQTFMIDNNPAAPPHAPRVEITSPTGGERWSKSVNLTWRATDLDGDPLTIDILARQVRATDWMRIASGESSDGVFTWDTTGVIDGDYEIMARVTDGYATIETTPPYPQVTIDNLHPPVVNITMPQAGDQWTDQTGGFLKTISWEATDPDAGDQLTFDCYYRVAGSEFWYEIATGLTTQTTVLDIRTVEDGLSYQIKVVAKDGTGLVGEGISGVFTIDKNPNGPVVELLSPDGGEYWSGSRLIRWTAEDGDGEKITIDLAYSVDNGTSWHTIAANEANDGAYNWDTRTVADGVNYLIRITARDASGLTATDCSMRVFKIDNIPHAPVVRVISPNGICKSPPCGEFKPPWSNTIPIQWHASDADNDELTITLLYSDNAGASWHIIASNLKNPIGSNGSYDWVTNDLPDGIHYLVKVVASDANLGREDVSDATFEIDNKHAPKVTVLGPNGGEEIKGSYEIRWTATDVDPEDRISVSIYYKGDGVSNWAMIPKGEELFNTGRFVWDTTKLPGNGLDYLIRIVATDSSGLKGEDVSDKVFTIDVPDAPVVKLISPSGGEIWAGLKQIKWEASDPDGERLLINIAYTINDGIAWKPIISNLENTGRFLWDTGRADDNPNYRIRIQATDGALIGEAISGAFQINNPEAPVVELISPNGGEDWHGREKIEWYVNDSDAADILVVTVEFSFDNGRRWYKLVEEERSPGGGSFYWETTTVENGTNYLVRITAFDGIHRVSDQSTAPFRIDNNWHKPTIELLSPRGGEVYSGQEAILWEASDLDGDKLKIHIYYGRISETTGAVEVWYPIALGEADDGYYAWDTTSVPDGARYKIKVVADDEDDNSEVGEDQSAQAFIIDNNPHIPVIRLLSPQAGKAYGDVSKTSSRIQIEWELEDVDNQVDSFKIEFSHNGGKYWEEIINARADNPAFSPPPTVSGIYKYNWETKTLPDGDYLVRVTVNDGHMINNDRNRESFTIDNRHAPTVTLISPDGGENLRGDFLIRWQASDIDAEDTVSITIAYSRNSGSTWLPLATGEDNDGEYLWNTTQVPEGTSYLIRVSASDGILYSTDQSDEIFTVDNTVPAVIRITPADKSVINAKSSLPKKIDVFLGNGVSGIDEEHSQLIITRNGGDYLDQGSIDRSQPDHLIFTPTDGFGDGFYEVTVIPVDYAGLIGETKTYTFTIDQTAPLITSLDSSSPQHGDSIKPENREIIVKVVEQLEVESLTLNYKIYSGDLPSAGGTMTAPMVRSGKPSLWTFKAALPLKDKGAAHGEKVDYWITGKDAVGNPLESSLSPSLLQDGKATILIDEEPPVSWLISINQGAPATKDRLITVALNVSDTPNRMMICEDPKFDGVRWEDYVSSSTFKLSLGDGPKTIYVRYMDAASNESASDSASIILDTVSPTVAIDTPAPGAFLNQNIILIKGTAADSGSGLDRVELQINGGSWFKVSGRASWSHEWSPGQDGTYDLKVRAIDLAGNQKESESRRLHIDRLAPVPVSMAINAGAAYTGSREVTVSSTVEGSPAQIMLSEDARFTGANWKTYSPAISFAFTSSGDGKKVIYARCRDEATNESDTLSASIILDTAGPNVWITTPGAETIVGGEVVNITGGSQDEGAGVELVQISLEGGNNWITVNGTTSWSYEWHPTREGAFSLQARGKDKAGNLRTLTPSVTIYVDKTAPVPVSMKINSDQAATNLRDVIIALKVTGTPDKVRLSEEDDFAGASWRAYTSELSFQLSSGDKVKTVYAQLKDEVGNLSQVISDQILLDTRPPTETGITINAGAKITNSPNLILAMKATEATRMKISEDGVFDSEVWEAFASSKVWSLSDTDDGLKILRVKFSDEAGNETDPVSDSIELDKTPPEVKVILPPAGAKVAGNGVPVKVPVDGNVRVNLFYRWDQEVKGWQMMADLESSPYVTWWNTSGLGDGEYQIKAEGWDEAGNVGISNPVTLLVDHPNPDLESNEVDFSKSQFMKFSSGVLLEIPAFSLPKSAAAVTLSDYDGLRNLRTDVSAIDVANQKAREDVSLGVIPRLKENNFADLISSLILYDGGGNPLSIPFNQPLSIALPYPDANQDGVVDGTDFPVATLKVFKLKADRWEEVESEQAEDGVVWAGLNQTGVYTLMAKLASPAKSLKEVKVYPNPFRPSEAVDGVVKFINLRKDSEIRIYTLSGELIKTINSDELTTLSYGSQVYYGITWDGTNEDGDHVAAGVYIYLIQGGGDKLGKLSVIR